MACPMSWKFSNSRSFYSRFISSPSFLLSIVLDADASQEKFLTLFHVLDKHRDCRETLVSSDFPVFVFLL
jgi:hypothetical protein